MKEAFIEWNPTQDTRLLLGLINGVIAEYTEDGYTLTLRQLYYQLVSKNIIENTARSYKRLVATMTKARMAGFISWEAIEDRARQFNRWMVQESTQDLIDDLPRRIQFSLWSEQPYYVEVWVEKEALGNVVERACNSYRVPYMACKGYLSVSEAWAAGKRMQRKQLDDKRCVIIHLGDHDPSGVDMSRDNRDRVNQLAWASDIELVRIALNMDQIEEFDPPTNPAKQSDSRATGYIECYGEASWELDALPPDYLVNLIRTTVEDYIDQAAWDESLYKEKETRQVLYGLKDQWSAIELGLLAGHNFSEGLE